MNRSAFIVLTAIVLILAFGLGWVSHWLVHRFTRVAGGDMDELDRMARELHEAEELRDQALDGDGVFEGHGRRSKTLRFKIHQDFKIQDLKALGKEFMSVVD